MASMIRHRKPTIMNAFHIAFIFVFELCDWLKVKVVDEGFELCVGVDELNFLLCHNGVFFY